MSDPVNIAALEPLYGPSDTPNRHRVRAQKSGGPAEIKRGRRPSQIEIANNLREEVDFWREAQYGGASDTSIELLNHWFHRDHQIQASSGEHIPFSYYFCQQEAIETLIYLHEVRQIRTLSRLVDEFGGVDREIEAIGVDPSEDLWPRYAFKIATGAGKTKIMSLAIVWSYFHALRESDSPMARHFVIVAPGLTVFERLKEDFSNGAIFDKDPLIPTHWRGDWNMSVVLQDEASGVSTGGAIYLTNIHRLYDGTKRGSREPDTYDWMGPKVSKKKALETGRILRQRITSHQKLMVLNDEAHHLWDPRSAWNDAINFLHESIRKKGGGLVTQIDLSATPKDNKGKVFRHVVVDTPLGEAVDGGIVKTPIIGHGDKLTERAHDDAAYRYENHLQLGYQRWLKSKEEWDRSGKKALLFVMTESTAAADSIARRLNTDKSFSELNGKTINLHTNLKGKLRAIGRGKNKHYEFIEDEKKISDEDLEALRKLSRELDNSSSQYRCIVSVLMLREGWDVRNVTTIIPLRPLSADSKILPEQTLGRGLRRMTPPGSDQAAEIVTVVEHKAFSDLYRDELSQEGLPLEVVDIDKVPRTTVTIFPDVEKKDLDALDLELPQLTPGYRIEPELSGLKFDLIKRAYEREFQPLPLGKVMDGTIEYEGRHLITNEVIERMQIKLALLSNGIGAVSFFREELEHAVKIRGQHAVLAPLIKRFLEEVLFESQVTLSDERVVNRLADADVREHIRGAFVPLLLTQITHAEKRIKEIDPISVTTWKPFQATFSEKRPAKRADKTPFNLVSCGNHLEVAFANFADFAEDVVAFAKNAGPQALRIDYLNSQGRRATYTPDFFLRDTDGNYLLVETKGRADRDVPAKSRAAVEWCRAASRNKKVGGWSFLYVPQSVFERLTGNSMAELVRACIPSLAEVIRESETRTMAFSFEATDEERAASQIAKFIAEEEFSALPSRYQKAIEHAVMLFQFHSKKKNASFAPVFQPLLGPIDHAAESVLLTCLQPSVPVEAVAQKDYFAPDISTVAKKKVGFIKDKARQFKRLLLHRSPLMPTGVLIFCLEYGRKDTKPLGGVFTSVREEFSRYAASNLEEKLKEYYDFRNTYIAHEKRPLHDSEVARKALVTCLELLRLLFEAPQQSSS